MKGVTPVIAVILLLMITVAMVGFAFVWFTSISQKTTQAVENSTLSQLEKQEQKVRISNIDRISVPGTTVITVRSTGTRSVPLNTVLVFVNDVGKSCTWTNTGGSGSPTVLVTQGAVECRVTPACTPGDRVRVDAPAGPDEAICP